MPEKSKAKFSNTITPFLWFDDNAEEAINFYTTIFKNSRILNISRSRDAGPRQKGKAMSVTFELNGQKFMALNGGPYFKLNEAFSLYVDCKNQEEVDELWETLTKGGEKSRCGWLKDKFGVSWQIIPSALPAMLQDKNPKRAQRAMEAMLKMDKIDIARLKRAYNAK